MKKLVATVITALCIINFASAQEDGLKLSGEMKTGLFMYDLWREVLTKPDRSGFIHNSEDTDWKKTLQTLQKYQEQPGRFRLNFQYDKGIIGTKFRFETTQWPLAADNSANKLYWSYAFVYGTFFDNNLKVSAGKMGDSPWGTGGPEMWKELDTTVGMRFEFTPTFIPVSFLGPGSINIGFVVNNFNGGAEDIGGAQQAGYEMTMFDIFGETVIGLSYTHDYFHVRMAYRLDSLADGPIREEFLYRAEERAIQKSLPGFQIWANGFFQGLNPRRIFYDTVAAEDKEQDIIYSTNWLYIQYDPDHFITQLRLGYDINEARRIFTVRPSFYYKLFNNLLQLGVAFEYAADVGDVKLDPKAPYLYWYVEPQIRLNLAPNSYIALVYRYFDDYQFQDERDLTRRLNTRINFVNLRVLFTF
jgi:hypothetical protein